MAVFQSKKSQHNFRSNFTPPKNSAFSHHQLQSLKFSAANFLTDMFSRVATIDSATEFEKMTWIKCYRVIAARKQK